MLGKLLRLEIGAVVAGDAVGIDDIIGLAVDAGSNVGLATGRVGV